MIPTPLADLTARLRTGANLDEPAIGSACDALLDAAVADDAKADFLTALAAKGESPSEIAGFVRALLGHAVDPGIAPGQLDGPLLDVCGTGGDRAGLFNVSTAVMFVAAAGGARVAKHGNRSITSRSGGADVLEALGIPIHLPPPAAREALARNGAVFLFAPDYHPAFKAVAGVRKKLAGDGVRTVFNILGPLLNPARPTHQLAGVFSPGVLEIYPPALRLLGRSRAWVVHGTAPGAALDEISTAGPTHVRMLDGDGVAAAEIDPATHGVPRADLNELSGDDAAANARIIVAILDGSAAGPQRDLVVVNAAGALCAAGLAADFGAALEHAARLVRDGDALRVLRAMQASA